MVAASFVPSSASTMRTVTSAMPGFPIFLMGFMAFVMLGLLAFLMGFMASARLGLVAFLMRFMITRPMGLMALCWPLVAGSLRLVVHAIHLLRFIFVHGDRSPTYSGG